MNASRLLPGLDILRLLATLYLVMYHIGYRFSWPALTVFFTRGPSATELFFILSGFLLTHCYGHRLNTESEQWQFLRRRWARLYPPYLLGALLVLGTQWLTAGRVYTPWNDIQLYLLMVQTWIVGQSHVLDAPGWSASCLMFFYLVFPLATATFQKMNSGQLWLTGLSLWLVGSSSGVVLSHLQTEATDSDWAMYLHNSPLLRIQGFLIGIILYFLYTKSNIKASWPRFLIVHVIICALLFALPREGMSVNNGIFLPLIVILISAYLVLPALLNRWAQSRALKLLASSTISIYLLHMPLIDLFQNYFGKINTPFKLLGFLMAVMFIAAGATQLLRPVTLLLDGRRKVFPLRRARPAADQKAEPNPASPTLFDSLGPAEEALKA